MTFTLVVMYAACNKILTVSVCLEFIMSRMFSYSFSKQ